MNIDQLRQKLQRVEKFDWRGEAVYLRKVGAVDGVEMYENIKAVSEQTLSAGRDREATLNFHVFIASKSLANEQGELQFDSEAGRQLLGQVPFDELVELGDLCLDHSGFTRKDAKKNSATNNLPPTDSAVSLDSGPTLTTSLPT